MDNTLKNIKINKLLKKITKRYPKILRRLIMTCSTVLGIIIAKLTGILNKENLNVLCNIIKKLISIIQMILINHIIVFLFAMIIVAICVTICICAKFEEQKKKAKYNSALFKEVLYKRDFDKFIIKESKDGSITYSIIKNDKNIEHHQYNNKIIPFRNNKTEVK